MQTISFVIPCYNSEINIKNTVQELQKMISEKLNDNKTEIILVNDSSKDNTIGVIENLAKTESNITAIDLARNFGQHNAIMAGLREASGDIIVCLDDDGQTPPAEAINLINKIDDNTDVVYAI